MGMRTAPLPEPIDDERYVTVCDLWRRSGLCPGTIHLYQRWVKRFLRYCRLSGMDDDAELTLSGTRRFTAVYAELYGLDPISARGCARSALFAWRSALSCLGRTVPPWEPHVTFDPPPWPLAESFIAYRARHRGIAVTTQHAEAKRIGLLLTWFHREGIDLAGLCLNDLDRYVMSLTAQLAPKTVAGIGSSLRAFLRYLYSEGIVTVDLSVSLALPVIRSGDRPPRALPWTDVQRILAAVDRTSRIGRRDYAMLLMMSLYGLGAGEVIGLQLGDVDWRGEKVRITRRKTGKPQLLPLLPAVAVALADFLQHGRPNPIPSRAVFIRLHAPYEALSASSALRHRIVAYAREAGVDADFLGSHVLRHSHATRELELGVPVKVISDILGHARAETTSGYVRSATARLRCLSLPVPQ